jgi:hypothetical protein
MSDITTARPPRNGVDVPTLFATLDAVKANPEIADFRFRAHNTWVSGTNDRTTIQGFYGAGRQDTTRTEPFTYDADHPAVLVGTNKGPTPVEFLLHAIAIDGDATPEQLPALVEQSRRRSAVYHVLTNGTDVVIDVNAA